MFDEVHCRLVSLINYLLGIDDDMILDNDYNIYVKGRKIKAQEIEYSTFEEKDFVMENNGVKFYRK